MTSKFCLQTKEYEMQGDIPSVQVKLVTARKNKNLAKSCKKFNFFIFIVAKKHNINKSLLS